ncbi:HAMP domain-containing histidine kinase [bacterium]|nr:HAMP domain-containing histidine kinase [bacterium]
MNASSKTATNSVRVITSPQEPYIWRPKWFLAMRFIAITGVSIALIASRTVFHIKTFDFRALWVLTALLLVCNILYVLYYRYARIEGSGDKQTMSKRLVRFITVQINIDLVLLTLMLHFSGGATNPFVFYYFFHTILSTILLSKPAAYTEASLAAVMFSAMTLFEGEGILKHYALFQAKYHTTPLFIISMISAVPSALYITVYLASSIMERLRLHRIELEVTLDEVRRLEMEKSRFLDVVAHDLKSPIASIESLVTSLLSVQGDKIEPSVKQTLERIPKRTKDLISFIQELLEFSRISNLKQITMQFKTLNFLPIVTATVEIYMSQALDKNIRISVQADPDIPPVLGSREHLEHMVSNLVSNAIRYTRENGSVTIKITAKNGDVFLTVADTGIGIPEDALPKIFTDFFRASNAKKFSTSGTGLGMSITKAIVEKHGGTISVQSQEGEGTAFTVRLPAAPRKINSAE